MSDQQPTSSMLTENMTTLRQLARYLVQGPDAQDLVQDTIVLALTHPLASEHPKAWLRQVMRNRAIDRVRRQERRQAREQAVAQAVDESNDAEARLFHHEVVLALRQAFEHLEEPYREVLRRRFLLDQSPNAIAQDINCPAPTVRWRIHEGLARLRTALDRRFEGRQQWMGGMFAAFSLQKLEFSESIEVNPSVDSSAGPHPSPRGLSRHFGRSWPVRASKDLPIMFSAKAILLSAAIVTATGMTLGLLASPATSTTDESQSVLSSTSLPVALANHAAATPPTDLKARKDNRGGSRPLALTNETHPTLPAFWQAPEFAHCRDLLDPTQVDESVEVQVHWKLENGQPILDVVATSGCYPPETRTDTERQVCGSGQKLVEHPDIAACVRARELAEGPKETFEENPTPGFLYYIDPQQEPPPVLPTASAGIDKIENHEVTAAFQLPGRRALAAGTNEPQAVLLMCGDMGPFTKRVNPTLVELLQRFPELELRWLQSPPFAIGGSYLRDFAAIAAQKQNKFWEALEVLLDLDEGVSREDLLAAIATTGVDMNRFQTDLDDPKTAQQVADQHAWCDAQGLKGSPAFLLGNKKLGGARPLEFFVEAVAKHLGHTNKSGAD